MSLAAVALLSQFHVFEHYELLAYDLRLQMRPKLPVSDKLAVIEIDDQTLQQLNEWPLPRDFHASLIDVLNDAGAKAVVFDIIFTDETPQDKDLAASIKRFGRVYLPKVFYLPAAADPIKAMTADTPLIASVAKSLLDSRPITGHINAVVDPDGKTRRALLFIRQGRQRVMQLGLKAACDTLALDCSQVEINSNSVRLGHRLSLPVINDNELMVNYPGTWENSFERFSYLEVLKEYQEWKDKGKVPAHLARLKGRVCFVGLTAAGTVDLRPISIQNIYPMVGMQASIFNSIVQNQFIRRITPLGNATLAVLILALCLWMGFKGGPRLSFLGSVCLGLFYAFLSIVLMDRWGIWIDLFLPLLVIVCAYLVCISLRWLQEIQMRKVLEKEMSIAAEIQRQFLFNKELDSMGVTVDAWFSPAKFVSGDLYEMFKLDDHKIGLMIGDVSGKGLSSSLLMAQAISYFRIFSRFQFTEPGQVLQNLNYELSSRAVDRFVTVVYCVADKQQRRIQAASAGHGSIYKLRKRQKIFEEIPMEGSTPLGIMNMVNYKTVTLEMEEEDVLILVSDGVLEARNALGREWGVEGLRKTITDNAGKSAREILECIKAAMAAFLESAEQFDDITLIIFSFKR